MASAASYSTLVQELYVAYFGRPADYFGLQNFEAALAAANAPTDVGGLLTAYGTNAAVKSLVDSFGTSAESAALYGGGTTASFVDAVFQNLFNRAPAVAGLSFWVNAIDSGAVTQGDAALAIAAGAAANTTTQGQTDNTTLANKLAVASNFTTELGTSSDDIVAYSGAGAATTARGLIAGVNSTTDISAYQTNVDTSINTIAGQHIANTYILTTGVDTFVGGPGNDAFDAVLDNAAGLLAGGQAATLNAFDSITGGTLVNTLNITDFGTDSWMTIPSSATITGITTLNINSLEGIAGTTSPGFSFSSALDLTGWTDLTALNINSSNNYYNIVSVGDDVAVNIVTSGSSSEYVLSFGGSTVNVSNTSSEYTYNYITGGAHTSSVSVSGSAAQEEGSETYVYDLHNSGDNGYDGSGTTPGWSAGTNSITTFNATNQTDSSDNYIYSDALTTINLTDSSYDYTYVYAAAGTRALTLNLSNDGNSTYYTDEEVYIEDLTATSVTVNATGTAINGLSLYVNSATALTFNDAVDVNFYDGTIAGSNYLTDAAAKTVTITGAGAFTADLSGLGATTAIDASGSSGKITVEMAVAGGQSFIGGTGQDVVTVGPTQTGTVTGGSATNNEIVLTNAPGATVAALSIFSHFSILGVAGTTSGTFDISKAPGFTAFDVQGSGGAVTFENVTASPTLSLSVENGNVNAITLATTGTVGPTETVTLNVGTTTSGGNTYSNIALEDSSNFGIGTVNLVSNVASSNSANIISKLGDNNLVSLTLSGTGFVHIANVFTDSATSVSISNSLAASSSVSAYLGGFSDAALTSLTFGGSAGIELATLVTSATSLTLVDNAAGAVIIDSLTDSNLTSATFTNTINSKAGTFTIDGVNTEAALATLTLNGNVGVSVSGDAVTSGITVAGSTDNADVSFVSVGATASGKTDSITLGNGSDTITLGAGVAGSTQTVTLGNGAADSIVSTSLGTVNATVGGVSTSSDSITADSAATVHITAGDGTNAISATSATSATVTVGSGANSIILGAGATGNITLGTHAATVVDSITVGASGTSLTAIDKISGLSNAGLDTITFAADTAASVAAGGMQKITAADLTGITGSDPTSLASWIEAATGAAGSGVTLTAHGINWFTFQTNTYLVETSTGTEGGTLAATDTVVELTGTGYTFAKGTATAGVLHLLG